MPEAVTVALAVVATSSVTAPLITGTESTSATGHSVWRSGARAFVLGLVAVAVSVGVGLDHGGDRDLGVGNFGEGLFEPSGESESTPPTSAPGIGPQRSVAIGEPLP